MGDVYGNVNVNYSYCKSVAQLKSAADYILGRRKEQVEELITSCKWKTYTYCGKKGVLGTGPNGRHIFLASTGYATESAIFNADHEGYYWIGELSDSSERAYAIQFNSDAYNIIPIVVSSSRRLGYAVRAVKKK